MPDHYSPNSFLGLPDLNSFADERVFEFLEDTADGLFVVDATWTITYVSRKFARRAEGPRENMIGRNLWETFPGAVETRFFSEYHRAVAEQVTVRFEEYYQPDDRWYEGNACPFQDGLLVYYRDITERKVAEEKLRESEERFRRLAGQFHQVFWFTAPDPERVLYVSPAFESIWGATPEELYRNPRLWTEAIHPEDQERVQVAFEKLIAQETEEFDVEYRIINREGETRWIHDRGVAIRDHAGRAYRLSGIAADITARKQIEEQLRRSEDQYRDLFENGGLLIGTHDVNGKVLSVNQVVAQFCGVARPEDLIGKCISEFLTPDVRPFFQSYLDEVLTTGHSEGIMKAVSATGEIRFIGYENSLRQDGAAPLIRCIGRDMTAQVQARAELHLSKERFRSLSESSPVGIWHTDINGQCLYINKRWEEISGLSRKEGLGDGWQRAIHPDDRAATVAAWQQAVSEEKELEREFRVVTPSGELRWVHCRSRPVRSEEGQVIGFVGTDEDITSRKLAEEALALSEARFRGLSESSPIGIFHTDVTGRRLYTNARWQEIFGLTSEQPGVEEWTRTIHPDDLESVIETWEAAMREGREYEDEFRVLAADGQVRWVHGRARAMTSADGRILGYVGTDEDITERRLTEERLREQARLLDQAREAIIALDPEGSVQYWNRGAERIYGWKAEEVLGQNISAQVFRDELPAFNARLREFLAQGEWAGELQQLTRDGHEITVESRWTLVRDEAGKHQSSLIINTDVTEKKRLEIQFLRAQRMESIGALSSGIAHDLNNLLSPMLLVQHILEKRFPDEDSQRLLKTLLSSIKRAGELVRQVVAFARGAGGEQAPLNPQYLLREIEQLLRETFPKSIEIRCPQEKHPWAIRGDATQLYQAIINLCVNARDAMPKGGRLILAAENAALDDESASLIPGGRPGRFVCLSVADTGGGIPADIRDHIFDPFFTTKKSSHSAGLGLSTVKRIVMMHSGFIAVDSSSATGARFRIFLPTDESMLAIAPSSDQTELPIGQGELILLVEDEAAIREVTRETLETYGYRVLTASNSAEAIALHERHARKARVILLDLTIPQMDSQTVIQTLHKQNPKCTIIAMSGLRLPELSSDHLLPFITHYLQKPFTAEKLLRTLAEILGR
jgi:PAS domain S-box-containing protein